MGIHELQKPCWKACPKIRKRRGSRKAGCGIYDARPEECQDYICHWREGLLQRRHRPDRSGIIIDSAEEVLAEMYKMTGLDNILMARETYPNAAMSDTGQEVLTALSFRVCLLVSFHPDTTRFARPAWAPTPEARESIMLAVEALT